LIILHGARRLVGIHRHCRFKHANIIFEAVLSEALPFGVRGVWAGEEAAVAILNPTALMMVPFVTYKKLFSAAATLHDAKITLHGGGKSSIVELVAMVRLLVRSGCFTSLKMSISICSSMIHE